MYRLEAELLIAKEKVQRRESTTTNYRKLFALEVKFGGCVQFGSVVVIIGGYLSFDIESLIGTGREDNNGFSGISEKTSETETENVKKATTIKAIAINELSTIAGTTKISATANSTFDRNLIKPEFLCSPALSRLHPPGASSTASAAITADPESKCLGTAFHAYPCVSGSKSQCAPSSPSVSGWSFFQNL
uniref:Uncharacterized protein n=1 Tax=Elaeophora elaphi TaxID=1147741 RepID=A0A0R3RUJ9_9BILA